MTERGKYRITYAPNKLIFDEKKTTVCQYYYTKANSIEQANDNFYKYYPNSLFSQVDETIIIANKWKWGNKMMQIKEIRNNLAETLKHIRNNYEISECSNALMSDVGYSIAMCDVLNKRNLKDYLLQKYDYSD